MHTGSCVAGVVGTKIPHYSVFGETVEIAGLMESTGEPMKIQVTVTLGQMTTYWNHITYVIDTSLKIKQCLLFIKFCKASIIFQQLNSRHNTNLSKILDDRAY